MAEPVPALIVAGFLGAGKTTLVQHLLDAARADGHRLAIISNEFGDTGIDRALMERGEEGFVELDGGCVCCRLSDALGETVRSLLERVTVDRLVLELSGVALPGDVVVQFWREPIRGLVSDEVVAVVVDAERALDEPPDATWLEQVEAADLLLLSKTDRVDAAHVAAATERLRGLTGGQPVLPIAHGRADPRWLFPPDPAGARQQRRDPRAEPHAHTHEHFVTDVLSFPDIVDAESLVARLAALGALRVKGFVTTDRGPHVVQGVGDRVELSAFDRVIPAHLLGQVVVIRRSDTPPHPFDGPHDH